MLSRSERAKARLGSGEAKNSVARRSLARVVLIIFVWLGICVGTIFVFSLGVLLMGGPKLLLSVLDQSEPRVVAFGVVATLVGGIGGGFLGSKLASIIIEKTGLLSEEGLRNLL